LDEHPRKAVSLDGYVDINMRRHAMMLLSGSGHSGRSCFSLLVMLLVFPVVMVAQMPPHPDLLRDIEAGRIERPYVLDHLTDLRKQGIDAPWADTRLNTIERSGAGTFARTLGPASPNAGTWRALVILVDFSDKVSRVTATSFDSLLFGTTTASLRDYYRKVTYYNLDIVTVHFPGGVGWLRAPSTYAYYTNAKQGLGTYPQNAQKLVEDAVAAANPLVDFSLYDNDGNGYVDALFIVHAGSGAEYTGSANDIWSHAWSTRTAQYVDGVYVRRYSMEPEYWATGGDMTIGVYAHELGHSGFGLPDLYDRDGSSNGLGKWSVMASGSWNGPGGLGGSPSFPDAWSHAQMGYLPITNIAVNTGGKAIPAVEDTPEAFRLWTNGVTGTSEYFLVQNRQRTGYDTYLPNSGLLIFHVDQSITTQNDSEYYPGHTNNSHYLVALEQADGLYNLEKAGNRGDAGDSYPGTKDATNFNLTTTPNSRDYDSLSTSVAVQNISESALVMTADLLVSATAVDPTLDLSVRAELEGPYSTTSHQMANTLKSSGILAGHFGGIPIPGAAIDSIAIEVRNAQTAAGSTLRQTLPAWLLADGSIRAFSDTASPSLGFVVPEGDYYVVVSHRNHLSIMSAAALHLSEAGASYDFTTGPGKVFNGAAKALETGVYGLFSGDLVHNGGVDALDRAEAWNARNANGYLPGDANLSGSVDALDRMLTWNNRNIVTQVP
jgi:M6 family metalloprotease-like protein